MSQKLRTFGYGTTLAAIFALVVSLGATVQAQQDPAPDQLLSPDQLDYLVAPIALYPDPLISQILVAATYPLEIVEAHQWTQRNPNLKGAALSQGALNQDWDPSIQALVVFPDVLKYLTEDISWTTSLGNAFLAQEGDVMDAIQRMRARAAQSGKLQTTPEQQVIPVYDGGQAVYEILPTNPAVIYVPVYDPFWIWGPPVYYPYARWYYPPQVSHFYFSSGIYLDTYFGSGWYGSVSYGPSYRAWNSWGWRPAWNSRTVVVNNVFIDNHYYNASRPRNATVTTATWSHDVSHRRGVVYPATRSYDRYRRDPRDIPRPQTVQGQGRNGPAQVVARNAGTSGTPRQFEQSNVRQDSRDGRPDVRQDTRPDTRQGSRPETRPDTRQNTRPNTQQTSRPGTPQDTRIAGRDVTPNSQIRDTRGSQEVRNGGGNINQGSGQGSSRIPSNPALTHTTPAQVMLSRPASPAPNVSNSSGRSQNQPVVRESQPGRSTGTSVSRPQYQTPSRETASVRGPAPSVSQGAPSRQSVSIPQSAPAGRVGPSQQAALSSNAQAAPSRQSAPQYGSAPAARSAPSQQSAPSHGQGNGQANGQGNGQGAGRSSNGGSNGGGHSKGGR